MSYHELRDLCGWDEFEAAKYAGIDVETLLRLEDKIEYPYIDEICKPISKPNYYYEDDYHTIDMILN